MERIRSLFESFNDHTVLIIGDVMVDSYMWGKVSRISPEAPVPVVAVDRKENRLGGAANVALNIKAMGAKPILCSVNGKDFHSELFKELLKKEELSDEGILNFSNRHTTVKTRIISQSHQMLRVDEETEEPLEPSEELQLINVVTKLIEKYKPSVVIFEDYDKGAVTPGLIKEVVKIANSRSIPVTVDPKKKNFHSYDNVTLFKPNLKELKEGLKTDADGNDLEGLHKVVSDFRSKKNIKEVLLTLSEHGVLISNGTGKHHIPAHIRNIADVSGAGDTVISVASLCVAAGLSPQHTAILSNLAGGQVCEKVGVVPVNKEQLLQEVIDLKINL